MARLPFTPLAALLLLGTVAGLEGRMPPSLRGPQLPVGEVRAVWVVRDSLVSPASTQAIVDQAVAGGFNTLFVQVRGRGDAFFAGIEPRADSLRAQPSSFDPLASLLAGAHAAGVKVHAWVSVNLVASAVSLPASRDHVVNRHPEWLMLPRALAQDLSVAAAGPGHVGQLARWTRVQTPEIEGLFLSPIVPAAAAYTVSVVEDLVRRYPVDGVHLDYIRYPGPDFDYSRLALENFAESLAPTLQASERATLAARAADDVLAWVDAYPARWAEFRRSRLTALVMRLRSAVRAARPGVIISAAVVPDSREAFETRLQDWPLWAENQLLDVVCPMAYTRDLPTFRGQIAEAVRLAAPLAVWAGIGAYRLTPGQAVAHIEAARTSGAAGVVLFSYDTMAAAPAGGYLETIRRAAFRSTSGRADAEP